MNYSSSSELLNVLILVVVTGIEPATLRIPRTGLVSFKWKFRIVTRILDKNIKNTEFIFLNLFCWRRKFAKRVDYL